MIYVLDRRFFYAILDEACFHVGLVPVSLNYKLKCSATFTIFLALNNIQMTFKCASMLVSLFTITSFKANCFLRNTLIVNANHVTSVRHNL